MRNMLIKHQQAGWWLRLRHLTTEPQPHLYNLTLASSLAAQNKYQPLTSMLPFLGRTVEPCSGQLTIQRRVSAENTIVRLPCPIAYMFQMSNLLEN